MHALYGYFNFYKVIRGEIDNNCSKYPCLSGMLLAHQHQHVWEKYTGWKDYPKHPSWQYKEAFWKGHVRCFYRCVKRLRLTTISDEQKGYKHLVCFVCNSSTISQQLWDSMREKNDSHIRGSDLELVDLCQQVLVAKRVRTTNPKRNCITCDLKVMDDAFYDQSDGLCRQCDMRKKARIAKLQKNEVAKIKATEEKLRATQEELAAMKRQLKVSNEQLELLRKDKLRHEADLSNSQSKLMFVQEEAIKEELERQDEEETLARGLANLRMDVLKTSSILTNNNSKLVQSMDDFNTNVRVTMDNNAKMQSEIVYLQNKVEQAIFGIAPRLTSPFGVSLGIDIWYFGVFRCATAHFQPGLTNIERQGNIAFYNKKLVPSIRQLLDANIPIVSEKFCHEGIPFSLAKLEYLYPALNWHFAAVDIVRKKSSKKTHSLRKERDEIIPLLSSYVVAHDYKYYTKSCALSGKQICIGVNEINALT